MRPFQPFYVHASPVWGQSLLEGSHAEPEDIDMSRKESDTETRVLSVAQDLVYKSLEGDTGLQNTLALPAHSLYKIQGTGSVISQCWPCYQLSQSASS